MKRKDSNRLVRLGTVKRDTRAVFDQLIPEIANPVLSFLV